jgi:predicted RNA binding protein YcfA (HicA-like mRNA interferase family)
MADFYRDLVSMLRANGWQLQRKAKGSHEIWFNPATGRAVIVPPHNEITPHR